MKPHVIMVASLLAVSIHRAAAMQADDKKPTPAKPETLPLKAAATLRFDTTEGTWTSVDVSPDGTSIVFDMLGDLYTLPIVGGTAKRIVGGISFESQPHFSPNGKRIVFISDRSGAENLWTCTPDGTDLKAITKGRNHLFASPVYTPDGAYILASRTGAGITAYGMWMFNVNGGTGIQIQPGDSTRATGINRMGIIPSPDGKYLYYAQRTGSFSYNVMLPVWQVYRFDRNTSEIRQITNAQGSAMRPLLSPDGRYLVYATRFETETGLRVRDLVTGTERWLAIPVTRDDQESRATRDTMPGYAFMPDGKSLVVPIGGHICRVNFADGHVAHIPYVAHVEAEIGPRVYFTHKVDASPMVRARLIRTPQLSPDGKRVVFSALNHIWVEDLALQKAKRLTTGSAGEFSPSWSPDGAWIAYATWGTQGGDLFKVSSAGGEPLQLTHHSGHYEEPTFTPGGTQIVFLYGSTFDHLFSQLGPPTAPGSNGDDPLENPTGEIGGLEPVEGMDFGLVSASGGEVQHVADAAGSRGLHFADQSDRLYFTQAGSLTSIRLDGQDKRVILKVTGEGPGTTKPGADQIVLAPDAARAVVSLQNQFYIVPVPRFGKETVTVSIAGGDSEVPVKKLSAEGGYYLHWAMHGTKVTWAWGSQFLVQSPSDPKPQTTDIDVEISRSVPQGVVAFTGARIVTLKGDQVIENGDMVIRNNRIEAVGAHGSVTIPPGAAVIPADGKTIIPGYVDVHSHMWAPSGQHTTQVWQYMANLAYGVTTTRDPQNRNDVFDYSDLVETGDILGPRIYSTGPGIFSGEGISSLESARNFLKRYSQGYKTTTLKEYMTGDRIVREWVIMACKELGLTSTTEGGLDLKLDLSQMADGMSGSEHALPIQPLYRDVTEFVVRTGTYWTPTILVAYGEPWEEDYYFEHTDVHGDMKLRRYIPHDLLDSMVLRRKQWFSPEQYGAFRIAKGVADVVHAGGHCCLGSHGQLQGLGAQWEIWDLSAGGLTPLETLRCATLFGAQAIGLQADLGSLESGKLADLQVLDGNPLQDIHNTNTIRMVMKNGTLYDGTTLDELWPHRQSLPTPYWQGLDPKEQ